MERIIVFIQIILLCIGAADAAVRDGNAISRGASAQQRVTTTTHTDRAVTNRETVLAPAINRGAKTQSASQRGTKATQSASRTTSARGANQQPASPRSGITPQQTARASTTIARDATESAAAQTRVGAEYELCKTAYFTCMDQFCSLKNDDYRRCSCSNRVLDLTKKPASLQDAGEQLTVFNENLDAVGMTAAQAAAIKNASAGENALTSDSSASKALLQAIMNSIRGEDSTVGGKYSDLNSITMVFDTSNAFGITDAGQVIATYNGQNLYNAVYPQCRNAVRADCNDASLQRAITAYLMAVEQDCNTVQTAIEETQKKLKSAVRESSAMLDLARVENRQKHNADDLATCIANIESAILSEEVCGAGYHKCLDNGEFIDITTGAPIAGVVQFYKLQELLKFADGIQAADQKLTQIASNRIFVQNFEKRTKKFAEPALDKCVEQADEAWTEYLNKAMLDIYYAQRAKVKEIKQGCFDFVSGCYMNGETALTAAMKNLIGDATIVLQPDSVALTTQMCTDYVQSCNNLFDGDIIADYINNRQDTDTLTACRAVAKQCFDKFGGTAYENYYYPYSGLFQRGNALDWFTLYEVTNTGTMTINIEGYTDPVNVAYKSECAKQLTTIDACNNQELIEQVFGGFDLAMSNIDNTKTNRNIETLVVCDKDPSECPDSAYRYGKLAYDTQDSGITTSGTGDKELVMKHHLIRSTGIATEVYNQILNILSTNCINIGGRFMELQWLKTNEYNIMDGANKFTANMCKSNHLSAYPEMAGAYKIQQNENMCPKDYTQTVDVQSWGACLCWENGGRRSRNGYSPTCIAGFPITAPTDNTNYELSCTSDGVTIDVPTKLGEFDWCITDRINTKNQLCAPPSSPTSTSCSVNDYVPTGITVKTY